MKILKKIVIKAPEGVKFLGEFMKELPSGILNKVECGCGATSIALEND